MDRTLRNVGRFRPACMFIAVYGGEGRVLAGKQDGCFIPVRAIFETNTVQYHGSK